MLGFGHLRCLFERHQPNRRRVRDTPEGSRIGNCIHCGAPIKRIKRDHWERDWRRTFFRGAKIKSGDDED